LGVASVATKSVSTFTIVNSSKKGAVEKDEFINYAAQAGCAESPITLLRAWVARVVSSGCDQATS
jgi:hypothetical protein